MFVASVAAARFLGIDVVFAPLVLAATGAASVVQAQRLWSIDATLTRNLRRIAAHNSVLEGREAGERLESGLKLLATVLPLDEAVIFCFNDEDALTPAARLRSAAGGTSGGAAETNRNSAWREGVHLCERAIAERRLLIQQDEPNSQTGARAGETARVALPLRHEARSVGALLIRLRGSFDESDRPLLETVGAQVARDLQRDGARAQPRTHDAATFFSARAAEGRLEFFGVVSGLLTEQSFAAHALSEASDAHAVAYLDGTIAYVNDQMLRAARLSSDESRALDLFGLLARFRTGVFDEPSIAVRRVLQTGDAYEREFYFSDRNQTLALRIALVSERPAKNAAAKMLRRNRSASPSRCAT